MTLGKKILASVILLLVALPWLIIALYDRLPQLVVNEWQWFNSFTAYEETLLWSTIGILAILMMSLLIVWLTQRTQHELVLVNDNRQKLAINKKSIAHLVDTTLQQSDIYEPDTTVQIINRQVRIKSKGVMPAKNNLAPKLAEVRQLLEQKLVTLIGDQKVKLDIKLDLADEKAAKQRVL